MGKPFFLISLYMNGHKIGILPVVIIEGAVRDAFMWSHVHFSYQVPNACTWSQGQHK